MNNWYRELRSALFIVVITFVVTVLVSYILGEGPMTWARTGESLWYNIYYGIPLTLGNAWLFDYLSKLYPWDKQPRKRAWIGILGSFSFTMALLIGLNLIFWYFMDGNALNMRWLERNQSFLVVATILTAIITITLHAIGFFQEVQRERIVNEQLRQEKLETELGALRSQVDPHFLFNSFNVLSGLIDEDRDKAQLFLARLSSIYRYVLEQRNEATSTVAEELDFARKYLSLQQTRFEDSIQLEAQIPEAVLAKKIPSLSLQLLLENAVKHNGFDPTHPLRIKIKEESGQLVVQNNRKARNSLANKSGMGLQNITDRYRLLAGPEPEVQSDAISFTVKLPLL